MENICNEFAVRLGEQIEKLTEVTPETLAQMLLDSGIVNETRVIQFCAVCEFYDLIATETKTQAISRLSAKYGVSERLLIELTGGSRRFMI